MSGSTEASRLAIIGALDERSEWGLPIEAENRDEVVNALGVNLPRKVIFGTLDSFRFQYPQFGVSVCRTGSSDGGMARGWRIGLSR